MANQEQQMQGKKQQTSQGKLPNPYEMGGRLPNPYALSSGVAPGNPADEQEQVQEKKPIVQTHFVPQHINRPVPKAKPVVKKPAAPKPSMPSATSTFSDAPGVSDPPTVSDTPPVSEKPSLDYFRSTAEDDAEVLERRRLERQEENRLNKERKKLDKKHQYWRPNKEYVPIKTTRFGWYMDADLYKDRVQDFHAYLRHARLRKSSAVDIGHHPESQSQSSDNSAPNSPAAAPERDLPDPSSDRATIPSPPAIVPAAVIPQSAPVPEAPKAVTPPSAPATQTPKTSIPPSAPAGRAPADFAEKLRLAKEKAEKVKQAAAAAIPPPPPPPVMDNKIEYIPPPPPPPPESDVTMEDVPPPPPTPPAPKPYSHTISAPPVRFDQPVSKAPAPYSHTISAPPVRFDQPTSTAPAPYSHTISGPPIKYAQPPPTSQADTTPEDRPPKRQKKEKPSPAPPKQTLAEKIMAKMGYVPGSGLGKNSDGMTTHLEVKIRKDPRGSCRQRDDDSKSAAQQVFDITGGLRNQEVDHGRFGEPSRVIVAWGCADGVDFDEDAGRDDGGIRQEIGDAFNAKFGPVQRIHVNVASPDVPVYIQFKDPLVALNAVNRLHEGHEFQGRRIRAVFYDEGKFEQMEYEH